mmetsp:Transcript_4612/g.10706  ORF Transcript_4612/g.10706 Transcript_4612/m.10706 type:complete len:83 (-) Transcript_4612:30-278(-)
MTDLDGIALAAAAGRVASMSSRAGEAEDMLRSHQKMINDISADNGVSHRHPSVSQRRPTAPSSSSLAEPSNTAMSTMANELS